MNKTEKQRVLNFCNSYLPTRQKIAQLEKDVVMFEKRVNAEDASEFERSVTSKSIRQKRAKIEQYRKTLLLFEIALTDLDGIELSVIQQLFVKGKRQNEVVDANGNIMTRSWLNTVKDRALETIWGYVGEFLPEL